MKCGRTVTVNIKSRTNDDRTCHSMKAARSVLKPDQLTTHSLGGSTCSTISTISSLGGDILCGEKTRTELWLDPSLLWQLNRSDCDSYFNLHDNGNCEIEKKQNCSKLKRLGDFLCVHTTTGNLVVTRIYQIAQIFKKIKKLVCSKFFLKHCTLWQNKIWEHTFNSQENSTQWRKIRWGRKKQISWTSLI